MSSEFCKHRFAANESLLALMHDIAAAGVGVVACKASITSSRPTRVRHAIGIELDLERFVEAADGVDLGDARHLPQLRGDVPFQQRAQLHRCALPLAGGRQRADLELQDFAERRGQRRPFRRPMTPQVEPAACVSRSLTSWRAR